jgi:hypothetical protein
MMVNEKAMPNGGKTANFGNVRFDIQVVGLYYN